MTTKKQSWTLKQSGWHKSDFGEGEVYALGKLRTGEEVRGNYLDLQGWRDPNKTTQVVLGTQACCSDQWLSHCRGFPSLSISTTPAFKVVVL